MGVRGVGTCGELHVVLEHMFLMVLYVVQGNTFQNHFSLSLSLSLSLPLSLWLECGLGEESPLGVPLRLSKWEVTYKWKPLTFLSFASWTFGILIGVVRASGPLQTDMCKLTVHYHITRGK